MSKIVTRFAPSPTGMLHIGGVRTALFNYIFAKQNNGHFILRIEDTDKERSKKEYETRIIEGIDWLGFDYGNTFTRQSEREKIYQDYLSKLVSSGNAYISKEEKTVDDDGKPLRGEVIRFKNPNKKIVFDDMIRGKVEVDTSDLGDFVIAKSMTEPLYHLAVIVDDFEMKVSHVIRGEEHLSNTPRQILILEALGFPRPIYAHLPLILDNDRAKLSKRKHGERVWLDYYIKNGYLREGIINFLALLGWNPGTEQEIFSIDELIKLFDITKVQKAGAVFNDEKLKWFNKEHILRMPKNELHKHVLLCINRDVSEEFLATITPVLIERVQTFGELRESISNGDFSYFFDDPDFPAQMLLWKGKGDQESIQNRLGKVIELISELPEKEFTAQNVKSAIWDFAEKEGRGDVLWPMRVSLSGKEKSPDPFIISGIIGKEKTIARLNRAIKIASK